MEESKSFDSDMEFSLAPSELYNLMYRKNREDIEMLGGLKYLSSCLKTDIKSGIMESEEDQDFQNRLKFYGVNKYDTPKSDSFLMLVWLALKDYTLRILLVVSVISLLLYFVVPSNLTSTGEGKPDSHGLSYIEGVSILTTVIVVVLITAGNEYVKNKKFQKLENIKINFPVKVVRRSVELQLDVRSVVVGDVVILDTGDQIPADGILIKGYELSVDQSSMTGENFSVEKSVDDDFFLISGTTVADGLGRMLVLCVGANSEYGRLMASMSQRSELTPLQVRLNILASSIARLGLGAAVATFLALVVAWSVSLRGQEWRWTFMFDWVRFFIISTAMVIVSVPEGLSLAVAISLAYSMSQMVKDSILVRRLSACETMGGVTAICSDKTGTLTMNCMTVVECAFGAEAEVYDAYSLPEMSGEQRHLIMQNICINSKAYINDRPDGSVEFIGNKTECALLMFARQYKVNYKDMRESIECFKLYPFSSSKKRMSVVVPGVKPNAYCLLCKGAWEVILTRCVSHLTGRGVEVIDDGTREKLTFIIEGMASKGLRVLALACRNLDTIESSEAPEYDMTLLAIFGIADPLRPGVPDAVRKCQTAGICVRMVTGDNLATAKKIAAECNIYTGKVVLDGKAFQEMSDEDLDMMLPNLQVLARAQPLDKLRLVKRLQLAGHVVAVTGDGTNDSPALKQSDIGLAMGIMGTEVAKVASDIIIMDDNFVSIVKSIIWGRNVYANIQKFVQFQLTINVVALVVEFIGAVSGRESPMSSVQLLWINVIMDTFAALALATEKPNDVILNAKPYGKSSPLITPIMWRNIAFHAVFQISVLLTLIYCGFKIFSIPAGHTTPNVPSQHYTIIFNTFVWMQVFNQINSRSVSSNVYNVFGNFFVNYLLSLILVFTAAIQVLIVQYGSSAFSTQSLTPIQWVVCVGIGSLGIPYGFLLRLVPMPPENFEKKKI